jgi:hypothetical protein
MDENDKHKVHVIHFDKKFDDMIDIEGNVGVEDKEGTAGIKYFFDSQDHENEAKGQNILKDI